MADENRGTYSFYSSESEEDDASTMTTEQEGFHSHTPSFPRRLHQKFQYTHLPNSSWFWKGKDLFQRVQDKAGIDKVPLPFVKEEIQPGKEWIKGAILCAYGTAAILVFNMILTIIAIGIGYSKQSGDKSFTYAELYEGDCSVTSGWVTGMHVVINILSSALLAASNYVMQCLSAPSRSDVDKAHSRRDKLNIGVLSLRNLLVMDAKRKVLWALLFISSLPIHMLFNTAIFSSISSNGYGIAVIPKDLGEKESLVVDQYEARSFHDLNGAGAETILAERFNGTYKKMSISDCAKRYDVEFNTKAGTALLVTERNNLRGFSCLAPIFDEAADKRYFSSLGLLRENPQVMALNWDYPNWTFNENGTDTWGSLQSLYPAFFKTDDVGTYSSVQDDIDTLTTFILLNNPGSEQLQDFLGTASNWQHDSRVAQLSFRSDGRSSVYDIASSSDRIPHIAISECWTKDVDQHCQFYFSLPICLAVIFCNIVKVCCMYLAARTDHKEIFLTVGDALSSFLNTPDTTKRVYGPMSKRRITHGFHPRPDSKSKRWLKAASWTRWTVTSILFIVCLAVSIFLYNLAIPSWSVSAARELGFGKPNGSAIIFSGQNLILLALLANTPQIVFSALYLLCNGLFTCMTAVAEYNSYAIQRKPLRVSWPKGEQRSTYYLSLAYRYSVPLIAVSSAMHWLLSQCIFLVKINAYNIYGQEFKGSAYLSDENITACGYSPLAMFITIIVGISTFLVLTGFSFRRLRSNLPLDSYCSIAISAVCHPPPGDESASLKPVMYGEVLQDEEDNSDMVEAGSQDGVSHYPYCTFTSKEVTTPRVPSRFC